MKVLHFITTTELGGAQKVCIDLCEKAVKEDFQVAVASMKGGYLWSMLASEVIPLPLNFLQKNIKLSRDFLVFFELIQIMKEFKPDILHLHSSKAGVLGRLVGMFFKTKIVYTVHGFDSIRKKYNYFLPLERLLQKHCDAIIPVSFYDKKNLEKERITKNLTVIQNGCMENTNKTTHPYLESLKNSNQKIIMTIARIADPKRLDLFLSIAKKFENDDYKFVWIGGSTTKTLEEIHSLYDVPKNAFLAGDIPNASSLIHLCDIFILLSDFEGLPITIIEAMSKKKPIVASNVGGIPEVVNANNGALINTIDEAIEFIQTVLQNKDKLNQLGLNSYEQFKMNFTLDSMWEKYKNIYLSII